MRIRFLPVNGGAIADVVRIIGRHPAFADFFRKAPPPEDFLCGRDVVAFRLRRAARPRVSTTVTFDAPPLHVDRQRPSLPARAHYHDIVFAHAGHGLARPGKFHNIIPVRHPNSHDLCPSSNLAL